MRLLLALSMTLACWAGAGATARPSVELPVATDARLEQAGDVVRLTMALSQPVPIETSVIAGPDRIIVDLPSVNFQVQPGAARKSAGFVSAFRFGLFTAEKARIIIDLSHPALVVKAEMRQRRGGFGELVVEMKRASRSEFQAAAGRAGQHKVEAANVATGAAKLVADPRQLVVIDPGHGGIDPGAVVAAIAEKSVVLAFGMRLKESLEATGRYRVVMTRDDDRFVSLGDRVKIARAAGADLFVSIHADSLTQSQEVRGATVYTASERATDAESARLAAKENQADAVGGLETAEEVQDVAGILMDLAKRETRTFSSVFARNLVEKLGASVKMHKVPLRSAGFKVLGAPDVPSVLIELGYMSSPRDAELLNSEAWRRQAVSAVGAAIEDYFVRERTPAGRAAQNRQ
ncbi:MAG: N-acetylmuramoyl-L-alanine amidase [Bosea sp. (in: a-proteobacteria)]